VDIRTVSVGATVVVAASSSGVSSAEVVVIGNAVGFTSADVVVITADRRFRLSRLSRTGGLRRDLVMTITVSS
jgi:hypothetical protein